MTIHIQMLQDIATHARAMADSMQAIVDDCAEQLARRKAAGESEESIMNESFNKVAQNGFTPYEGPTPFDEKRRAPDDQRRIRKRRWARRSSAAFRETIRTALQPAPCGWTARRCG